MKFRAEQTFLAICMAVQGLGLAAVIWFRRQDRRHCATSCPCGGAR